MPHDPVNSMTYNFINGDNEELEGMNLSVTEQHIKSA